MKDKISVLSLNAQSINNKFQVIRDVTYQIQPIILAIQEIWGKNDSTDYSISSYHKPEMRARAGGNNAGGGVGIWIRKDLDFEIIKSPFIEKEIETITVHIPTLDIILINVYRPFGNYDNFIAELSSHISDCRKTFSHSDIMVAGDFNVDLDKQDRISHDLIDTMSMSGFIQQVTLPTRITDSSASRIDHFYSNSRKKLVSNVIAIDISDHLPTLTHYLDWKHKRGKIEITKRWIKTDDYGKIDTMLKGYSWTEMSNLDLEGKTNFLIKAMC
jgi:exonuclease III